MSYSRPSSYPYPSSFKNIKDVEEYQKKLYASLMENDRNGEFYRDRATPADLTALIYRPEWYGAKGDGVTDDTSKIQAAINAASAAGGGTVLLAPNTTYLLSTVDAYRKILCLKSNVNIFGCGYTSVLKIANGIEQAGGSFVLSDIDAVNAYDATAVDNIILHNFRIDCNDTGNQLTSGTAPYTVPVAVFVGDNITIDGLWIDDNPGQQCICVGANTTPPTATSVRITNNRISNVADNSIQNDHSSIYSSCDGAVISGNILTNPAANAYAPLTSTALEIHGRNTVVEQNVVDNYRTGANIVAGYSTCYNNRFTNNIFNDVNSGFQFWQADPYELKNTLIAGNSVRLTPNNSYTADDSSSGIISVLAGAVNYENVTIVNNHFETTAQSTDAQKNRGIIFIYAVDGLIISGNTFENIGFEAIRIIPEINDGRIEGNNIASSNMVDDAAGGDYRNSVIYVGLENGDSVVVANNNCGGSANTRYGVCVISDGTGVSNVSVENNLVTQASVANEFLSGAITGASILIPKLNQAVDSAATPTFVGVKAQTISRGTADAADTGYLSLQGGGDEAVTRGGFIQIVGNEYTYDAGKGRIFLVAGNGDASSNKGEILLYNAADYGAGTVSLRLDAGGNLELGGVLLDTGTENVFAISNGTVGDSKTDAYQQYAADITAGNSAPHFKTEAGDIVKLYKQVLAADLKENYTTGELDSEAEVIAAVNATNAKINDLITAIINTGLLAAA